MDELYGPVDIESLGIILVPGNNENKRVAYARLLYSNFGVFIPQFKCEDIDEPVIALGTLSDYKCYNAFELSSDIILDPIFSKLEGHIDDLKAFNSYIRPFEMEKYSSLFDDYHPYEDMSVWLGNLEYIESWIVIEVDLRNMSSILIKKIIVYLEVIKKISEFYMEIQADYEKKTGYYKEKYNPAPSSDEVIDSAIKSIYEIYPDFAMSKYTVVSDRNIFKYLESVDYWFDTIDQTDFLLQKIKLIYTTFGQGVSEQKLTITSPGRREIEEIAPAISQQPGAYAVRLQQEQGPWATGQPISPRSRYLQDVNNQF